MQSELVDKVGRAIMSEVVRHEPDAVQRYGRAALEACADRIPALEAENARYREALPIFERVTRLADTLASDVPITAEARKHIDRSYKTLVALQHNGDEG